MIDRIGELIRDARLANNLNKKQLAARSKISTQLIWRIETGRVHSRVDTLELLLNSMGLRLTVEEIPKEYEAHP